MMWMFSESMMITYSCVANRVFVSYRTIFNISEAKIHHCHLFKLAMFLVMAYLKAHQQQLNIDGKNG